MMIYEICAAAATLAFIILVVYLVLTLRTLRSSLIKIDAKLDPVGSEVIGLLDTAHAISETVQEHLSSFNPLFQSISNLGSKVEEMTENLSSRAEEKKSSKGNKLDGIVELAALSILLWQQMKKKR